MVNWFRHNFFEKILEVIQARLRDVDRPPKLSRANETYSYYNGNFPVTSIGWGVFISATWGKDPGAHVSRALR